MKSPTSLVLLAMTLPVLASEPAKPRYRDAATHDVLVKRLQKAAEIDPMKNMEISTGTDPSKVNQPVNLLEQSDILCFNGLATLVPKRAVLAAPPAMKERLKLEQGTKIVSWMDFYRVNRGWITTVEVSRRQAEGRDPFAEPTQKRIDKSRSLVVATYKGGPITVLEYREPEPKEETQS